LKHGNNGENEIVFRNCYILLKRLLISIISTRYTLKYKIMQNYDMLVDNINQKLYEVYSMGHTLGDSDWDDDSASTISSNIIELVEEYYTTR
tara:strand:- start:181 stop:456 length:276 start_codon:yes stop_codon:yes gene_type:complete